MFRTKLLASVVATAFAVSSTYVQAAPQNKPASNSKTQTRPAAKNQNNSNTRKPAQAASSRKNNASSNNKSTANNARKPTINKPERSKPASSKPTTNKPAASKPISTKPTTSTKPNASKPASTDTRPVIQPNRGRQLDDAALAAEANRYERAKEQAATMMSLLAGEIAHTQGDARTSLGLYLTTLKHSRSPEVAERAMELAIQARAYPIAEAIYQQWQEIEPQSSPALRRLALGRALAVGEAEPVVQTLETVLAESNAEQQQRLFIMLAQMSVVQDDLAKQINQVAHRAALKYPQLAEAAIADALISAANNRENDALEAVQRLANVDKELNYVTTLALGVLSQKHPEVFNRFFATTPTDKLSNAWRVLEVESLITAKEFERAEQKLSGLLSDTPDSRLYFMAASIAMAQEQEVQTVLGYLDKAYQIGQAEQKGRAALTAAIFLTQSGSQYMDNAVEWAKKIPQNGEFSFDANALLASLMIEKKQWQQAEQYALAAEKMPEQEGHFFSRQDIQRTLLYLITKTKPLDVAIKELDSRLNQAKRITNASQRTDAIAEIYYNRGLLYTSQAQTMAKGIADFRQYLKLKPNDASGQNALGYSLLEWDSQYLNEAFDLIYAAYQQNTESAAINDSLGWAYYKKGEVQAALPYLEFAYEHSADAETGAHLGEVYWQLGQKDEARRVWQESWKTQPDDEVLKRTLQKFGIRFPANP
ncbi:tetratricopeptide repeat protein [Kingella kingae]|uniref:tetratricopeptide repeat protein n=1 Tax=Kingella kingae TaxID=504 RepID=UPI000425DC88|nr:tetratricopeptide repeat protein [Kingella kingae]MDK4528244.1 tetratricopeptide repeat protein [Kingella kingae]MDK4542849.1 tetratricopeptide repeat protein [Kingella kingae]MDK4547432.1 tetratricopeptide repeat protein [Kingella kingae]MDK4562581.1 tetratricopeptide repeat protein [Kingella kingae]MDK4564302.1 tetratricopeptide repeat protein [Kingella kingae]